MALITLTDKSTLKPKQQKRFNFINKLIEESQSFEFTGKAEEECNELIEELNQVKADDPQLNKQLRKTKNGMVKSLEKHLKLIPIGYYRNLWMGLGLAAFGLPLGTIFGLSMENMGLMGIGLPIGLVIGMVVGMEMDKKAKKEGRQIPIEYDL